MKVEVDVLGSPSLTVVNVVSVDVRQHWTQTNEARGWKQLHAIYDFGPLCVASVPFN